MGEIQMSRKFNAILGLGALAAFGFASSAFAQCPTGPVPPWSSQSTIGGSVAIAAGGYDGTTCRMDASLTSGLTTASAFVRDNTPADEPRYRGQFLVNADNLVGQSLTQSVKIFSAATDAPAQGVSEVVRFTIFGNIAGNARTLGVFTACASDPSGQCSASIPLPAGTNRVEFDWQQDAAGSLRVWVNNGDENSPNANIATNNTTWGGVDFAVLGLSTASPGFRTAQVNRTVGFDEFDSRRTSFIGE
jgi:hypothetical protein